MTAIHAGLRPVRDHFVETVELALPIIVARAGVLMMFVVDTVMTGWVGARDLAALALGTAPQLVLMLVAVGALQSVVVLTALAQGRGDATTTGAVFRAGLLHALALGVLVLVLSLGAGPFFRWVAEDPDLAAGATAVTAAFAWGTPGLLAFTATNLFLEATGRPRVGMITMLVANLLNVVLNGVFALGWGGFVAPMGAVGAVATSSALRWAAFLAAFALLLVDEHRRGDPRGLLVAPRELLAEVLAAGGEPGRAIRRMGLPMGAAQGMESAAFATVVFLAGRLGTVPLAAYQVTMNLVTLVFMSAVGTAGATAIRVGWAAGRGEPAEVGRAGRVGIVTGMLFAAPFALAFVVCPSTVAGVYSTDPEILAIARHTLVMAGCFMCFDAGMGVVSGALRGIGDVWVPTLAQAAAFWFVAVPLAWALAEPMGFGPVGLLGGIFAGIMVSLTILATRFVAISGRPIAVHVGQGQ